MLKADTEVVKRNCQLLNAGSLYPLLASMVCARTWDSIANAELGKGPPSSTEVRKCSDLSNTLVTFYRKLTSRNM